MMECENIELGRMGNDGDDERYSSIGLTSDSSMSRSSSDCGESLMELCRCDLSDELSALFESSKRFCAMAPPSDDRGSLYRSPRNKSLCPLLLLLIAFRMLLLF